MTRGIRSLCIDCGRVASRGSRLRCRSCFFIWYGRPSACRDCGVPLQAKSVRCRPCWMASRIIGPAEFVEARTNKSAGPDACWPWTGQLNARGYGTATFAGQHILAHRLALTLSLGRPFEPGEFACHHCDNPPCVNPAHLFLGTAADNNRDMVSKGRAGFQTRPDRLPRGSHHGNAKLTEDQVRGIRARCRPGRGNPDNQTSLAREFGLHLSTVAKIVRCESWTHVQ